MVSFALLTNNSLQGLVHIGIPSHLRSISAILDVECMEARTYHFMRRSQVLSPKYDMNAYMTTLLEVKLGTSFESWVKQKTKSKLDPTLNTSPANIFS